MAGGEIAAKNEKTLRQVARAVANSQGQFKLMRLRCDYVRLRLEWMERVRQFCQAEYELAVPILELEPTDDRLYAQIKGFVDGLATVPNGLQIVGFERIQDRATLFTTVNQIRETLRESFPFPLLFWLDEASMVQLMESANDLHSWSTGKRFLASDEVLRGTLQAKAEDLLRQLLAADDAGLVGLVPLLSEAERQEIGRINQAVAESGESVSAEVDAGLTLLLGRSPFSQVVVIVITVGGLTVVTFGAFMVGWWIPFVPALLTLIGTAMLLPMVTARQLDRLQLQQTVRLLSQASEDDPVVGQIAIAYLKQVEGQDPKRLQLIEKYLRDG